MAPITNCAQNSPNSNCASRTVIESVASTASAKNDCAAVRNSSSRWWASIGRPEMPPEASANTIGSVPTSSVHWFTFEDTSVPRPAFVFSRQAYRPATSSSGASDASGASHWTRRNSLIPNCSSGLDERFREGSAHEQDHRRGEHEHERRPPPVVARSGTSR